MEPSIWEMQQQAKRRVEQMQRLSRRAAAQDFAPPPEIRRSTASLRAQRPSPYTPAFSADGRDYRNYQNIPPKNQNLPRDFLAPEKAFDKEQLLLLFLAVLLAKNGASSYLILALLYLAL